MLAQRVLDGRYEVLELIGRGGMADVHLGRDLRLGRSVAIKVLRQDLARDPLFQSRFRREAQAVAGLNNPNIVAVYDTGEEEVSDRLQHDIRVPFIVMEYVEGLTLRDRVRAGDLTTEESIAYLTGVLGALDYSHKAGIVHRDIKPANVMITPDGVVKVMDFGIARAMADSQATMTQTQAVMGTAQYLSPEQARGETVDARSDLYSAGCLLFEVLTGRPPFTGDSPVSIAYQHVREEPPRASSLNPDVTPALDSVLARALEKDREHRFQNATSFRSALIDASRGIALTNSGAPTEALSVTEPRTRTTTSVLGAAGLGAAYASNDPRTMSLEQLAAERALPVQPDEQDDWFDDRRHDEHEGHEDRRRSSSRVAWITVLFIAALLVLAGGYFALTGLPGDDTAQEVTTVAVPDLVALPEADAVDLLEDQGLNASSEQEFNASVEAGAVISSDPAAGTSVEPGSRIDLVVSRGPANVEVPAELIGLTEASARDLLGTLNLRGGSIEEENSATVDRGRVIRTDPEVGTSAPVESSVNLVLSSGQVTVPVLTDLTVIQAALLLDDPMVQLPYRVQDVENSVVEPGIIIAQSRPAESSVDQGTEIVLTVARTPAVEVPAQPAPEPAPPVETEEPPPVESEEPPPVETEEPPPVETEEPPPVESEEPPVENGTDPGGNGNGNGNAGGNGNGNAGGNGNGSNPRPTVVED